MIRRFIVSMATVSALCFGFVMTSAHAEEAAAPAPTKTEAKADAKAPAKAPAKKAKKASKKASKKADAPAAKDAGTAPAGGDAK